jgi:hypothetical protein
MPQPTTGAMRDTLLEKVNQLSPLELSVLQVLAVVAEPVTHNTVREISIKAGLSLHDETDSTPLPSLAPQLRRLKDLQLVDANNQINETIHESIARQLFADTQTRITPPAAPKEPERRATNRSGFKTRAPKPLPLPTSIPLPQAVVDAVRAVLPAPASLAYLNGQRLTSACRRTFRELRIALLEGKDRYLDDLTTALFTHCQVQTGTFNPLVRLLNNPFDAPWFRTLPPERQTRYLAQIFTHTFYTLETDRESLSLALEPALRTAVSSEARVELVYNLIIRLILGGQTAHARLLIEEIGRSDTQHYSFGFSGCIALLEGQLDKALELFAADLKELRLRQRKRTLFFGGDAAPFFLLALLRKGDADSLNKAAVYLDQAMRRCQPLSFMAAALAAIEAMLGSQSGLSPEAACRPLQPFVDDWARIKGASGPLFVGMALFAINGRLTKKEIESINQMFDRCRDIGLDWLAMEYGELLCRADKETSSRREVIRTIREATGLVPLTAGIEVEEPWRKSLRALRIAVEGAAHQEKKADHTPKNRIVYLLHFTRAGALTGISPLEQKLGAQGSWTKGRPIALQRLARGEKLDGLTEADQPLRAAIRRVDYYYGSHQYEFNLKQVLPALVGHPLLFLADSPATPVEVLKGEPEVLVVGKGKDVVVRFLPETLTEERYVLVRETPTRYRVVELTEAHHRLARILGAKGLTLPAAAQEEIAPVLASVATLVPVHSTIPGTAHSVETVPADPRPRVHLLPHGGGFRLEILIRPLNQGGPYLRPGQGAKNLMADVEGRKYQTERNLQEEKTRAAALERSLPSLVALPEMDGQWFAETPEEALEVLFELQEAQERGEAVIEWPEGEKLKLGKPVSFANLQLRLRSAANWFEINGQLRVDEERVLDIKEVLDLLQTTPHRFLPLGEGQLSPCPANCANGWMRWPPTLTGGAKRWACIRWRPWPWRISPPRSAGWTRMPSGISAWPRSAKDWPKRRACPQR